MKIAKIYIKGFQQFDDIELDFTHPETGLPLDKICFIGRNGTGKSTILRLINTFLNPHKSEFIECHYMVFKFYSNGKFCYRIHFPGSTNNFFFFVVDESKHSGGLHSLNSTFPELELWMHRVRWKELVGKRLIQLELHELAIEGHNILLINPETDLMIYSPSESKFNTGLEITDVPKTNLNESLELFKDGSVFHVVDNGSVENFWSRLNYLIDKRRKEQYDFENSEESLQKTKGTLVEEFNKSNPEILTNLSAIWDKILIKAGLEFDVKSAKVPFHLKDNLKAYIKLKGRENGRANIPYNMLSTGIRNFVFRLGHIYSLYFNREIKRGFLLVDEPENSLYPDFLYDFVDTCGEVIKDKDGENNTQMFMATHNPIIAAQFEPYERIILEFNDDVHVTAHKGHSPVGDDPNDLLTQDFEVSSLMGKKGMMMWERYLELRQELRQANSNEDKERLLVELNRIGSSYHF